jgi:molybdopterin-guanine dinucleotide biosynthesis protein A
MTETVATKPVGLVLAGGAGRRIGGGKEARALGGRALLDRALDLLKPQVGAIAISAGGARRDGLRHGAPQLVDTVPGAGPLAGLHAGLVWMSAFHRSAPFLTVVPTDAPFLPATLVAQLAAAIGEADAAVAVDAEGRRSPVVGLYRPSLERPLAAFLAAARSRAMVDFLRECRVSDVQIAADPPIAAAGIDPLFNVNTREDLQNAEKLLRSAGGRPL